MSRDKLIPEAVGANWDAVIDEAEDLASDYRERGWETYVIHPGDVTALFDEPFGIDVLASGPEFEEITELVGNNRFDQSHVYTHTKGDVELYLTIFEAGSTDTVVLVPLYIRSQDGDQLRHRTAEEGEIPIHIRPLSDDERVTFSIDDPSLLFES